MKRLLTAAIGVPLALLATFRLPADGFFILVLVIVTWATGEYVRIGRHFAPRAPIGSLLLWVPASAIALWLAVRGPGALGAQPGGGAWTPGTPLLLATLLALGVGVGCLVLFARTPIAQVVPAFGLIAFGLPYLVAAIIALPLIQRADPWLLFLLYAIVWLGDTAAYYVGSAWGRHKLAPVVSPKKSWEGAAASLAISLLATAVWSVWRLGAIDGPLLAVAGVTSVFAQVGDLVESLLKRGAGVKDSGHSIPGHGGALDRMDAMLFAAPVFLLALWGIGIGVRIR
jgi:phosphatidate cytidylyltransferase